MSDTLEPVAVVCPRCGGAKVPVRVLGQTRYRCERFECEAYRVHRRRQQQASATRIEQGPMNDSPERPSVEDKQYHYLHPNGEGFKQAIGEARLILDVGGSEAEAAEWIGFTVKQLREALALVKLDVSATHETSRTMEIASSDVLSSEIGVAEIPSEPASTSDRHPKAA